MVDYLTSCKENRMEERREKKRENFLVGWLDLSNIERVEILVVPWILRESKRNSENAPSVTYTGFGIRAHFPPSFAYRRFREISRLDSHDEGRRPFFD